MPAFRSPLGINKEVADADLCNWSKLQKLAPSNVRGCWCVGYGSPGTGGGVNTSGFTQKRQARGVEVWHTSGFTAAAACPRWGYHPPEVWV